MDWVVGDKNRLKSQRKKKVSLKNLKLINDYYCRTVRRRREKLKIMLVKCLSALKSSNVK